MESQSEIPDVDLSMLPDELWLSMQNQELEKLDEAGTTTALNLRIGGLEAPVVVVSVRSIKTGQLRRVVLMRIEHNGSYAAVASKGGCAKAPAWYHSLKANPRVQLQDRARVGEYLARELTGEERQTWWTRAATVWPPFESYSRQTLRLIPVFALAPITDAA